MQEYEPIYRATLSAEAAARASPASTPGPSTRRKRNGDEDSDEEEVDPSSMSDGVPQQPQSEEWSHKPERRMARMDNR